MRYALYVFVAMMLTAPVYAHARVIINEIAWMGTSASANDEWLELYNDGSTSVSVSGWKLSDETSLTINLTGTIGAGKYVVLERTDDSSVPGVTAFLTYTGALANSGRTLTLVNASGTLEDQVIGGTDWKDIGGDNATKSTAQRTVTGWTTAPPTPGKQNANPPTPRPAVKRNTELAAVKESVPETQFREKPSPPPDPTSTTPSAPQTQVAPEATNTIPIGNARGAAPTSGSPSRLPYYGLIAVILIATLLLYRKAPPPTSEREEQV